MFYVYILYSNSHKRTYVGQAAEREKRINDHNSGRVRSTKPYRPWRIIYSEERETREDALILEKWFKSSAGRKKIGEILRKLGLSN